MPDAEKDPAAGVPDAEPDDAVIGVVFRWSLLVFALVGVIVVVVMLIMRGGDETPVVIDRDPVVPPDALDAVVLAPAAPFTDVTAVAGVSFVHVNGATGEKLLPETMGAGVAFLDYDADGDEDLLLVNAKHWPHDADTHRSPAATPALYRNDGSGVFDDVTAGSGLDVPLYGMGVACGDYDNDGLVDVYVTALGANRLLHNVGSRFVDVTAATGTGGADDAWSTSAGFFDYDGDGDLDLFVCNYIAWTPEIDRDLRFTLNGTDRAYGPPTQYAGVHSVLYRNDGKRNDGTRFTDVSESTGIEVVNAATGRPAGKALAVTFVDVDRDGHLDVFVANDTVRNFLFRNKGDGTFAEIGADSGVAFDSMGVATGAMGIDAADFAGDGRLGVAIGNFANESTSFYVQQPRDPWQFADMADPEGIGSPSRRRLSFGLFFFDYDLDGRLDLLQANGHLEDEINAIQPSQHYRQPAQLFWNCGPGAGGCFVALADGDAGDLARPIVGRGAACADIDADGDLDVVLTQTAGPPALLRNDMPRGSHWLRVKLVGGGASNRDAIGAWVEVTVGGVTQRRQVMPTRSYLSQVPLTLTFGLGDADRIDAMRVVWPDGSVEDIAAAVIDAAIDRRIVIERGE